MVLALLSEAAAGMAKYELEERSEMRRKGGRTIEVTTKPATVSIVRSLGHLTATVVCGKYGRVRRFIINWEPLSERIMSNILHGSARRKRAPG